ncbi:hypothetical protein IGI04_018719, partial [Brassica rapa subsp. trilocularis]
LGLRQQFESDGGMGDRRANSSAGDQRANSGNQGDNGETRHVLSAKMSAFLNLTLGHSFHDARNPGFSDCRSYAAREAPRRGLSSRKLYVSWQLTLLSVDTIN